MESISNVSYLPVLDAMHMGFAADAATVYLKLLGRSLAIPIV